MNESASSAGSEHAIPAVVRELLQQRGLTDEAMREFLFPQYESLHDPFLMTGMEAAVERLLAARENNEAIVVYGDYDIDGITATAVLLEAFGALGMEARGYIPDRFEEGYGINQAALERLQAEGARLVVSVDCGITSVGEAEWAREHGLDLIITDHHTVPPVIPEAIAVINPKQPGDGYPFKELAGVGVAFKLAQALQYATGEPDPGQEKWWLDLVAMGTICDIVPLVGENRVLASFGLKVLRRTRRLGLRALAEVAGVDIARIKAYEVGFSLGPRMNAAGRLDNAARSLELVRTKDAATATRIAHELDELNRQRRATQQDIFAAADAMAEAYVGDGVLVLAHPDWSHGIVGIVASKLAEKWQRPVLLAQVMGDTVKGSARSVPGFHMVDALKTQSERLTKFGGHYFAAGFTLPLGELEAFRAGLNEHHKAVMTGEAEAQAVKGEVALEDLAVVGDELLEALELLEPCGAENRQPSFELGDVMVADLRRVGSDGKHLSVKLRDKQGRMLGAIGFGWSERAGDLEIGETVRVVGSLGANEFRGKRSVQMVIAEISRG